MNYYARCLDEGIEYQEFIRRILIKDIGINIEYYKTFHEQMTKGESIQGFEIKYNSRCDKFGCWIETQERSSVHKEYVMSGIYRNDNTWLYICGNYDMVFIFAKKHLQRIKEKNIFKEKEIKIKTSIGYNIPIDKCEYYSIKKIQIKET